MYSCIDLSIYIYHYVPPSLVASIADHVSATMCAANAYWPDSVFRGDSLTSTCELMANGMLKWLQNNGILPGAKEIISYSAECSTAI